jgi:hypothetical protein
MFHFTDDGDESFRPSWWFPIAGCPKLVSMLSMYTSGELYNELTAVYLGMDKLTSNHVLLQILAPSNITDHI